MLLRAFMTLLILILVLYRVRKDRFTRFNRENLGLLAIITILNGSALVRASSLAAILGFCASLFVLIAYAAVIYRSGRKP
ncbi:hypothetical protein [Gorillibacterium timonense]|uniref:hypothetical protein n=1 Tax=Gorillibacterium timonense TaxID=1689269 RepID=UPI00071CCD5B|nr:hypothetical protein [Gorillibacterium timonense]